MAKAEKAEKDKQKKLLRKSKVRLRKASAELLSKCRKVNPRIAEESDARGVKLFSEVEVSNFCDKCLSMVQCQLMDSLSVSAL